MGKGLEPIQERDAAMTVQLKNKGTMRTVSIQQELWDKYA